MVVVAAAGSTHRSGGRGSRPGMMMMTMAMRRLRGRVRGRRMVQGGGRGRHRFNVVVSLVLLATDRVLG
jgi:hypothetical protein